MLRWHCDCQRVYLFISFAFVLLLGARGFEDYELDLYDLVEEVNGTFYDFMDIEKDAATSDIRRAYRKLSLILHPDKNKNDDAEEKFRQLAGIYEILRSSEKREKYNDILVNGLPTWRQPLYYYRKVRKFGFAESTGVLLVIVSIIHYAMIWAAFWEKRFEIEEVFQRKMKKDTKRKNHQEYNDDLEEAMKRELDSLVRPGLSHMLVCRLLVFISYTVIHSPSNLKWLMTALRDRWIPPPIEGCADDEPEMKEPKKKVRCDGVFSNMSAPEMAAYSKPVVYQETPLPLVTEPQAKNCDTHTKKAHWTEADYSKLARAMQKFPAGTQLRWEKIAQQLNETPASVLSHAKQLQQKQLSNKPTETTALPEVKKKGPDYKPQGGISYRLDHTSVIEPQATLLPPQPIVSDWSQIQQKALESALASVPKTADDRWKEIASLVPGKTKGECIARYKHLASVIKQRKLNNTNNVNIS